MEKGNVKFVWEVTRACSELGWGFAGKALIVAADNRKA